VKDRIVTPPAFPALGTGGGHWLCEEAAGFQ